MKKIFSSAVPTVVALWVAVLIFLVGNFLGQFLPEGWLVPLAWGSSISLCVAIFLAVVACCIQEAQYIKERQCEKESSWFEAVSPVLFMGGLIVFLLGIAVVFSDIGNPKFIKLDIFRHPAMGSMVLGLFTAGVYHLMEVFKKDFSRGEKVLRILFSIACVTGAICSGSLYWIIPVRESLAYFVGYIGITTLVLAALLKLVLLVRKK